MAATDPGQNAPTIPVPTPGVRAAAGGGGKVGRRVLLSAAGLVACGGLAALTPVALEQAGKYTEQELQAAIAAAEANAKLAVYRELAQLEGVGLDVAIKAAQLTQLLVVNIVVPVFTLVTKIGQGALDILIGTINTIQGALSLIHVSAGVLDAIKAMFVAWKTNIGQLPQEFGTYANADFVSAESYLAALQTKVQAAENATPVPTPTRGII